MTRKIKIGRNQLCPCGSGKKYKRCCIDKPAPAQEPEAIKPARAGRAEIVEWPMDSTMFTPGAAQAIAEGQRLPNSRIHPWVEARIRDWFANRRTGGTRARLRSSLTLSIVRAMTTPTLLDQLARCGVELDKASFVAAAADHRSAWDLSDAWAATAALPSASDEFLGLAACELWRRLCPDRPSLEMLDELMQEGYDALKANDRIAACETWLQLTNLLIEALPPEVEDIAEADEVFPGLQSVGNWLGDAELELHNASLDRPQLAKRGASWCRQLIARFPNDPGCRELRRQEAEFHLTLGEPERGMALLVALREEDPDDAMPYAMLSDWYAHDRRMGSHDLTRAVEVLEAAMSRPVRNAEDWSLQHRLEDLHNRSI